MKGQLNANDTTQNHQSIEILQSHLNTMECTIYVYLSSLVVYLQYVYLCFVKPKVAGDR